jgi:nicotinate-nucleotide adenylyltransferase
MKTGILGGTFDPVHKGHIAIAREAKVSQNLSEVIFIPVGQPVFKSEYLITPAEHRLAMLRLAVVGITDFRVSDIEVERSGPSYTVDTLAQMRNSSNTDNELYFLLGWDSLMQLPEWREPERMIELCYLIAIPRPGCKRPDMAQLEASIPGITGRTILLDKPLLDISASVIREKVARGQNIDNLVPGPVVDYITEHGLYKTTGGKS